MQFAKTGEVYHINRTFTPVEFNLQGVPPVDLLNQESEKLTDTVRGDPVVIDSNGTYAIEQQMAIALGYDTAEAAWNAAIIYQGTPSNYPGKIFDNVGWVRGTKSVQGDWGAYLWVLQNRIAFQSSTSVWWKASSNGVPVMITNVIVGSLGNYAPMSNVVDIGPHLDAATNNFPGANQSESREFYVDITNVFYQLSIPDIFITPKYAVRCINGSNVQYTVAGTNIPNGVTWTIIPSGVGAEIYPSNDWHFAGVTPGDVATNYKVRATSVDNTNFYDEANLVVAEGDIMEMDFKDGLDAYGNSANNNFDIVDSSGNPIVTNRGPEWKSITGMIGPSVYNKNSKVRSDVKLKISPVVTTPIEMELYSDSDLDFTPNGTSNHTVTLTFDSAGYTTNTFTTYSMKTEDAMDRKEYVINWQGSASGNTITQTIYTLYGNPTDYWNNAASLEDPQYDHLKYLLGPKIGSEGEWCKGKSTLNMNDADSVPYAVQQGIRTDGAFSGGGGSCTNPWNVVATANGGVCEDYAELMKQSLLVAGVPASKLDRKSVVSSVIERSTWFGGSGKKLIKAFKEYQGASTIWINEGVCGINTDDEGWRYYDLAGSAAIGKGGWSTPNDNSDNNLWYEPSSTNNHGPVMYEIVEELYGSWTPQTTPPYEATAYKDEFPQLIEIGSVTTNGTAFTVEYRTEGAKDVGTKVKMTLFKLDGSTWVQTQTQTNSISQKWDNAQNITFTITEDGTYTVTAEIDKSDDTSPYIAWEDTSGPIFTRP